MNNQHKTAELALAKQATELAMQKASDIKPEDGNAEKVYSNYRLITAAWLLLCAAEVGDLGTYRNEKVSAALLQLKSAYQGKKLPIYVDIVVDDSGLIASENVCIRNQSLPIRLPVHYQEEEEDEL